MYDSMIANKKDYNLTNKEIIKADEWNYESIKIDIPGSRVTRTDLFCLGCMSGTHEKRVGKLRLFIKNMF
jgi:hypothetical protein